MEAAASVLPPLVARRRDLFSCPLCGNLLTIETASPTIVCSSCGELYGVEEGIPELFRANQWQGADVTPRMRAFYERTPFPNYEALDSIEKLKRKAREGLFARMLDEQIPADAVVLDAGCGTGQLANFLASVPKRTVVGADLCRRSLALARGFQLAHDIDNVAFVRMNLFRPALARCSFDLVISNGVLHHTSRPFEGFRSLAALVRPGGHILVGLYNRFGRLATNLRRPLLRLTGGRLGWLDPRLRAPELGRQRRQAWFEDQYRNPHESLHSIGEVLGWLDRAGFDFASAIPAPTAFSRFSAESRLFGRGDPGTRLDRFLVQAGMIFSGLREGGLFVVIGRKR